MPTENAAFERHVKVIAEKLYVALTANLAFARTRAKYSQLQAALLYICKKVLFFMPIIPRVNMLQLIKKHAHLHTYFRNSFNICRCGRVI
jgi:hypothetical protein